MSLIASASNELKFHQWPASQLQQTYAPPKHKDGHIKSISWSKDGCWVVVVPYEGSPEIVSIKDSVRLLQTVDKVSLPTCAVFQNSTKKTIAIGTASGRTLIYDIKSQSIKKQFPTVQSTINRLQYNAKDTHLAASCSNGEIVLYNSMTTNFSSSFRIPKSENVTALSFHRTRRNLLSAGSDEGIVVSWDINTNISLLEVQAHYAPTTAVTYSPIRSDMLVTAGLDRRFTFYDTLTKKRILEIEVTSCITALDFSYCGIYLGLGSHSGGIILYDTRNLTKPLSTFAAHEKRINHLLFQKALTSKSDQNSNSFNIVIEETPQLQQKDSPNQSNDSLAMMACGDSVHISADVESDRKLSEESADSFLAALSLGDTLPTNSRIEQNRSDMNFEDVKKRMSISGHALVHHGSVYDSPAELKNTVKSVITSLHQISSTPKLVIDQDLPAATVSPILVSDLSHKSIKDATTSELRTQTAVQAAISLEEFRDVVKEEFQTQMEICKKELRLEFAEEFRYMRRHMYDLHFYIVKQFIAVENLLEEMKNSSPREFVCNESLLNQNNELLKELNNLKERLNKKH